MANITEIYEKREKGGDSGEERGERKREGKRRKEKKREKRQEGRRKEEERGEEHRREEYLSPIYTIITGAGSHARASPDCMIVGKVDSWFPLSRHTKCVHFIITVPVAQCPLR